MSSVSKHLVDYLDRKPTATQGATGRGSTGSNASSGSPAGLGTHALDGPEHTAATGTDLLLATIDRAGLMPPLSGDPADAYRGDGTIGPITATVPNIEDQTTAETDPTLVFAPDGAGGVVARAEAGGTPADPDVSVITSSGSAQTLDFDLFRHYDITVDDDLTVTIVNPPADQKLGELDVLFRIGAGGPFSVTITGSMWPDPVTGLVGSAPDFTAYAEGAQIPVTLATDDGGITYGGTLGLVTGSSLTLSDDVPLVESGAGSAGIGDEASRSDHVHPASGATGGIGPLLLASDHATPIVFDDILQASDGSDFLYASEP